MHWQVVAGSHSVDEVRAVLDGVDEAIVATAAGDIIRTRAMHFAVDDDFTIYVSTMRNDPKTVQITHNPSISLLVLKRTPRSEDLTEVEITGAAALVRDEREKRKARSMVAGPSPIVKHLWETGQDHVLDYIKVVPRTIKMRIFGEIVQGVPPTVLEFPAQRRLVSDWELLRRKLANWLVAIRWTFLTASLISVLLGAAIAWDRTQTIDWGFFLLTLLAALSLHAGINVLNDYFDHLSGNDEANREFVRPFSGGSRAIQLGLLTPLEVLSGGLFLCLIAAAVGVYLAWSVGPPVLALGAVGLLCGAFYTAPPFNWAARGLGELLVGLNFGVLMTLGAYYVQAERLDWEPVLASLPVAFLIAAVLWINELPDYTADRSTGKRTQVVRLGRQRAAMGYLGLVAVAYASIVAAVALGPLPLTALMGLLTLPLAARAAAYALRYHSQPFDLAPANGLTIIAHLATGLLLGVAYAWQGSGLEGAGYTLALAAAALAFIAYMYWSIERMRSAFLAARRALK